MINSNRWHSTAVARSASRSLQKVTKESSRCEKTLMIPAGADASSCTIVMPGVIFGDPRFMTTGPDSISLPDKFDTVNNISISISSEADGVVVPGWDDFAAACAEVPNTMRRLHEIAAQEWLLPKAKAIGKAKDKKVALAATQGIQPAKMKQMVATVNGKLDDEATQQLIELHLQGKGCSEDRTIVNGKKTLYEHENMSASEFKARALNIVGPPGVSSDFPYSADVLQRGDACLVQFRCVFIAACNNFHVKLEPTEVIVLARPQNASAFSLAAMATTDFTEADDLDDETKTATSV